MRAVDFYRAIEILDRGIVDFPPQLVPWGLEKSGSDSVSSG